MRVHYFIGTVFIAVCLISLSARSLHAQSTGAPQFQVMELTVDDIQAALTSRRVTCRAIVNEYLKRIEAYNHKGPALNAVETVNSHALAEADRLDEVLRTSGPVGPLHCVPILVKDELDTQDLITTYGSRVFANFSPSRDATVVTKLKAAGAIILGKATMGEFASGYVSGISGAIRNPYDPTRHASGSSGGTGAGIAANFATVGIGEDTGGSVRAPASVGSLVGLRPTLPLVSRNGLFPARPSTDTVGPIARTVKDASLLLDAIVGYDAADPVTAYAVGHIPKSYVSLLKPDSLRGVRVGVLRQPQDDRVDPNSRDYEAIHRVMEEAFAQLKKQGAALESVPAIPNLPALLNQTYDGNVFETEAAVNAFLSAHANAPVKSFREILTSGKVLPSRLNVLINSIGRSTEDVASARLQQTIEELRQTILGIMATHNFDVMVYATADLPPGSVADNVMTNPASADTRFGSNRRLASVLVFPAVTVPAGFTLDGLPVGLEFMGKPFSDGDLLSFAHAFEQATHHRRPPKAAPAIAPRP